MSLPPFDEELDNANLLKWTENVCLQLKLKNRKWEVFLTNEETTKSKKFIKLQDIVIEGMKDAKS